MDNRIAAHLLDNVSATENIATSLKLIVEEMEKSKCAHGTPELFSPCVNCEQYRRMSNLV